jgi:hypothetical protein
MNDTPKTRYRVGHTVETMAGRRFVVLAVLPASKSHNGETHYRVSRCSEDGGCYGPPLVFTESHIARRVRKL